MKILAIESSCDETAVAIIENGRQIIFNQVASQINSHRRYGGVVPELASRLHTEMLPVLLSKAETICDFSSLDGIAVTQGPGLDGSLLVGVTAASVMSLVLNKPLIGVSHLQGHIYAHFLSETPPSFPFLALTISGGHTQLVLMKDHGKWELMGQTRDDAVGEAFDKVARLLGLGYPGGPEIERLALQGDAFAFPFPQPLKHDPYAFSFSGLKTAVMQAIQRYQGGIPVADIAASFQHAVIQVLLFKAKKALDQTGCETLLLCGGVAANRTLSEAFKQTFGQKVWVLDPKLCTDNAAMIGAAAYYLHVHQLCPDLPLRVYSS